MFLKVEIKRSLIKDLGIKNFNEVPAIDTDNIQYINRKDKSQVAIVRLLDGIDSKYLDDNIIVCNDEELELVLKNLEELSYRKYDIEWNNKWIEKNGFPEVKVDATEQERLKEMCKLGVWGVKEVSNLDNIKRW